MSGITLKKTVAASIPTPSTDKITIFHNDATDAPAYKDDLGATNPIGGGAPSGAAGGVLGGTYPNPSFAADMATQAELNAVTATLPTIYVAPGASIQTAINALPANGGIIQLGYGTYSVDASLLCNTPDRAITIQGLNGISGGADTATIISFSSTGSGNLVDFSTSSGCGFKNVKIMYSSTSFTGRLIALRKDLPYTTQATGFFLENVLLWGSHAAGQTAILLDVSGSIENTFDRVYFNGGGTQVEGARMVAVTGVSIANPSTITTATPHLWPTGTSVQFGGLGTTPSINNINTEYTLTSTGASTFTIPVNITGTTDVAGFVHATLDHCNIANFTNCEFRNAVVAPIKNPAENWKFDSCNFEFMYNGDVMAMTHDPGVWGRGVTFTNCWGGDQTTTATNTWITYAGTGLTVMGCRWGGRQVSLVTCVVIDDDGSQGINIIGNSFDNIYRGLDYGATTANSHGSGLFLGNAWSHTVAGYQPVAGNKPKGIGFMSNYAGTAAATENYVFVGSSLGAAIGFDDDTASRIVRSSAGLLFSPAEWRFGGRLIAGTGQTAGTQIYGQLAETFAGLVAVGTNTNINTNIESKGTGLVQLDGFNGTGGTQIANNLQLPKTITPTQLTANTDNWAPTNLARTYLIRVNVDAARTITGIVAQPAGTVIKLHNTTAFAVTLTHDATSTAANRFLCPNNADFVLAPRAAVEILYNSTDSRWLVIAPRNTTSTVRFAAGVPSGAPTGTEVPIAFDSTAVTGGVYYWTGAAWVKGGTI